jgi:periplasmic divalent cation tolerance protein
MSDVIAIVCTGRSKEEMGSIAEQLVQEKLVACANVLGPVSSYFHWEGKLCREEEALMIAKSSCDMFHRVCARIKELHPYELPEILAFPVIAGLPAYLEWVLKETHEQRS